MKRITLASVSLVFFILLTCSCSNPRTLYEKGSYREAVKAVDRVREPSSDMILLKAKSYIALGEDGKALESLFLYLLQDESRSAPEREWAVGQFIRLNASDQLAVMVLSPEDGKDACRRLFSAYTALGETDKAREMYKIVSEGLSGRECAMLLLEENADSLVILDAFSMWYEKIEESELDSFLVLLSRLSNTQMKEAEAKVFLSLSDSLMRNPYYTGDDYRLSVLLKIKGNILEMLYDRINARIYWSQALRLNPDDRELKDRLQ